MNQSMIKTLRGIIIFIIICAGIVLIKNLVFKVINNDLRKFIREDTHFSYSTSITSSVSSSNKADIYISDMNVRETVDYINNNYSKCEKEDVISESDAINISYDDDSAMIYKGDDSKVYVQIANNDYIINNGYRNMYRRGRWANTSTMLILDDLANTKKNSKKGFFGSSSSGSSSKSSKGSVKSSSSKSRTSVGGGTSFGK